MNTATQLYNRSPSRKMKMKTKQKHGKEIEEHMKVGEKVTKNYGNLLYFQSPSRRMKLKILKKFIKVNPNEKILEVGCGYGTIINSFSSPKTVCWGADYSLDIIKIAKQSYPNTHYFVLDLNKKVKIKKRFDKIFIFDVIEHVKNPDKLLKDCHKILNVSGKIYILTQRKNSLWRKIENWLYGSDKCGHYTDGFNLSFFRKLTNYKVIRTKNIYPIFTPLFTKINNYIGYKLYKTLEAEHIAKYIKKDIHQSNWKSKTISVISKVEYLVSHLDFLIPVPGDSFIVELQKKDCKEIDYHQRF